MISMSLRRLAALPMAIVLASLAGCGPSEAERQAEAQAKMQARVEAEAQKQYANYQQLKASGRTDLALNIADHMIKTLPQAQATAKIKAEVEPLRAQIAAEQEARRLKDLWVYHDGHDAEAGGRVRTAYIFATEPLAPAQAGKEAPRARLVLRAAAPSKPKATRSATGSSALLLSSSAASALTSTSGLPLMRI